MSDPSTMEVVQRAQAALCASPIYDLQKLVVEAADGTIELTGDVDTWHRKQMAQEVVRAVAGSKRVVNMVEVREHPAFTEAEASVF